jgi:hypothetical protein
MMRKRRGRFLMEMHDEIGNNTVKISKQQQPPFHLIRGDLICRWMPHAISETACPFVYRRELTIQSVRKLAGKIPVFRIGQE